MSLAFAGLKIGAEICKIERVENSIGWHAALPSHSHAPLGEIDLSCGMCIGIDAESASELQSSFVPSPIKVEPPRVGINLYRHVVLSAGAKDPLDIQVIARPPQQLTAGHMAKDRRVWICDGAQDALGLGLTIFAELAVYTRHDEIKAA